MHPVEAVGKAPSYGATSQRQYAQGCFKWIENGTDNDAACYALSLLWIREKKRGRDLFDLVGEEVEPLDKRPESQVAFESKQQIRYAAGATTSFLNGLTRDPRNPGKLNLGAAREKQNEMLAHWNVVPITDGGRVDTRMIKGVEFEFDGATRRPRGDVIRLVLGETPRAISKHTNSWVLVHIPNHTMAARVGNDRSLEFFDPNGGEVRFPDVDRFGAWFVDCFGQADDYKDTFSWMIEYYVA